jgi:hypothetical protein
MRLFTGAGCSNALAARQGSRRRGGPPDVDVCLIVEGCYPYQRGGVSNWIDTLVADQSGLSFAVISIQPAKMPVPVLYAARSNIRVLQRLELGAPFHFSWRPKARAREMPEAIARAMVDFSQWGSLQSLKRLARMCKAVVDPMNLSSFVQSKIGWESACVMYRAVAPAVSFVTFTGLGGHFLAVFLLCWITLFPMPRFFTPCPPDSQAYLPPVRGSRQAALRFSLNTEFIPMNA